MRDKQHKRNRESTTPRVQRWGVENKQSKSRAQQKLVCAWFGGLVICVGDHQLGGKAKTDQTEHEPLRTSRYPPNCEKTRMLFIDFR